MDIPLQPTPSQLLEPLVGLAKASVLMLPEDQRLQAGRMVDTLAQEIIAGLAAGEELALVYHAEHNCLPEGSYYHRLFPPQD